MLRVQHALITGAGRGIGRAIALALASEGAGVALISRTRKELANVAEECLKAGASAAVVLVADLTRPRELEGAADEATDRLGPIDILVNNAGTAVAGNALEGDPHEWERMLSLDLMAPMRLTRKLAPGMAQRGKGTIVNIGSVAGVDPSQTGGAYAAAKYGLRGWSLSCYEALRHHGVKVTLINPAYVDTDLVRGDERLDPQRMLRSDDVAQAVMLAVRTSPMCCPQEITLRLTLSAYK